MIIPDDVRPMYINNLIGGLAMSLSGPYLLQLGFHIFVVIVGGLILSGAVNTSIIGANGVLNRVAEDHVLVPWFREPHKRYGTTFRMINMITILQMATIIYSRGDMTILAEAYAFGVVWSFFMKALGVTVLRFQRTDQEYKFPLNFRIGGREIPVGLGVTTLVLGAVAIANLFTKQIATKYGIAFTLGLVRDVHDFREDQSAAQADRAQGDGAVQPGSSGAYRRRQLARAARLRAGGGARLQSHGAPETRARKNQSAPLRHRGDDGAHRFRPAPASTIWRTTRSSAITKKNCSATWWRWRRRKASRWNCWWCRR